MMAHYDMTASATMVLTPSINKNVQKTLSASVVFTPAMSDHIHHMRTLSASMSIAPALDIHLRNYYETVSATMSLVPSIQKHIYANVGATSNMLAEIQNGTFSAITLGATMSMIASMSMIYQGHDFATNDDEEDIIAGSSPVNVGNPVQSNG